MAAKSRLNKGGPAPRGPADITSGGGQMIFRRIFTKPGRAMEPLERTRTRDAGDFGGDRGGGMRRPLPSHRQAFGSRTLAAAGASVTRSSPPPVRIPRWTSTESEEHTSELQSLMRH